MKQTFYFHSSPNRLWFHLMLLVVIIVNCPSAGAFKLSGRITDQKGEPLPFASIMVSGSSHGTTSNMEGLYALELAPGDYAIRFSMIGYHQRYDTVRIKDSDLQWDVSMEGESYQLNELNIVAGEDPAYAIMRHAQEKRSYYLNEVEKYTCESYIKSTQRLTRFPRKFMGKKLDIENVVDTSSGIFYLSESISKIAFLRPGRIREEMVSSKVSGNPRAYSFNSAADFLGISVYNPLLDFSGLAPRGIISPLSGNSMFYYRFVLAGTFVEGGQLINKIKVIPRRKSDPVFTGDIFIVDGTWRVHSIDLMITKEQQLNFVDTFSIRQSYVPVGSDAWMPFSTTIRFHFNLLGFEGAGEILGMFKEYDLHPAFSADYFKGEQLKVESSANKRDSSYWERIRPMPLTNDELTDYHRRDSSHLVTTSAGYLDSVDRKSNAFSAGSILTGYNHRNSLKDRSWSIASPLQEFQFNTVEGFNLTLSGRYTQQFGDTDSRVWTFEPRLRYGFSNMHFCPSVSYSYRYDTQRLSTVEVSGGRTVSQFNGNDPISPTVNSIYSLWARKNYMKLYQQDFFQFNHRCEVVNGLSLGVEMFLADRYPLVNTSEYSFSRISREYDSNQPVTGNGDTIVFQRHSTMAVTISARIRFRQTYISRPEGKYIMGSRYPTLRLEYQAGIPVNHRFTDFQYLRAVMEQEVQTGLLGSLVYKVGIGKFLRTNRVEFMDYKHFNGNQTWFSAFRLNDFPGLDYYAYSTTSSYMELHAEQHFHGFLFNKIPGLRKLKLDEVVAAHVLAVEQQHGTVQLAAGLEKLNLFRVEVFSSLKDGGFTNPGILLGIKTVLGTR